MNNTTGQTPGITNNTSGAADLLAMVSKALREAYNLGQRYRQQADSEYISRHKKADDTRAKFLALVEETCAALAAGQATAAQALPPNAITASVMRDDGGEAPAFCLMAAYRSEKDAMDAFALIAAAPAQPAAQQGAADGFFLLLPQRPKPEAPAGTVGLDWDAYSGAQMLAFGRDCSDAAIAALRTEQPAPATQQAGVALSDDLRDRLVAISEAVAGQDDRAAQAMLREILKAHPAATQPAPVLWLSPEQFANFMDTDEAPFGKYIPARKTSAGKFTMPLFAALAPAQPVAEPAGAVSEMVKFTDQSTANPIEKARRYLAHVANKKPNNPYFFDDGYPRESIADDAAAALSVLEQLSASHGQAPASVLHLVNSAFAEIAMAFPKAFALHKVGIADKAVLEALAAPATAQAESVQEDAARWRELREQHESDENICCVFAPNDMRECLVPVGSLPGELDAFMDSERAARKQGASHDR